MFSFKWRRPFASAQQPNCCCPPPESYVQTVLQQAACRAIETHLPHALVRDRFADVITASDARQKVDRAHPHYAQTVIHTRYRQDFVRKHLHSGCDERVQIVALGNGLDAPSPTAASAAAATVFGAGGGKNRVDAAAFEVEVAPVVALKRRVVAEELFVHDADRETVTVAVDHQPRLVEWAVKLLANGFDTCVHTVWLMDYTSPLLRHVPLELVLDDVSAMSRPGSVLLLQVCRRHHANLLEDARRVFRSLRFNVLDVHCVGDVNASYGRWSFETPSSSAFITASKNCI
ncbi:Leucine carboxyl methyltransferase [Gracilaria domingensis]|nr:Leucine carboxyl methyltransferase [Gracilaria domingensis]